MYYIVTGTMCTKLVENNIKGIEGLCNCIAKGLYIKCSVHVKMTIQQQRAPLRVFNCVYSLRPDLQRTQENKAFMN
jgi:hypothetical protein